MSKLWWKSVEAFRADFAGADNAAVREMRAWAESHERLSDQRGMGRNPRARRQFRQMRDAANEELDRRGVLWPDDDRHPDP